MILNGANILIVTLPPNLQNPTGSSIVINNSAKGDALLFVLLSNKTN